MSLFEVITLDGPVGVGKSTIARDLAKRLGYRHVDTGATYRAVTLAAMRQKIDLNNAGMLTEIASRCDIRLIYENDNLKVLLNGEDVSDAIRDPEVSKNTSPVADVPGVRQQLVLLQRSLGVAQPSVLEGRDISTVVFPDAYWKFYLDASLDERTRRRVLQLRAAGKPADFGATRRAVRSRDTLDRSRPFGPLRIAPDAIVIDTTTLSREEVLELLLAFIHSTHRIG